jgi:glycosyltransferase involved in cell wall biosynthesis
MPFPFIKYITPIWYFNLNNNGSIPYFPDYDKLCVENQSLIVWDSNFSNRKISLLDAAYQAFSRGVIVSDVSQNLEINKFNTSLNDNYRFIRKYFHPFWSIYVLIIRILTLHNPVHEISAFLSQKKLSRFNLYSKVIDHQKQIEIFKSFLVKTRPKVSVIIPTLNRYTYLADALRDLEVQDFKNFNVVIVDQSNPYQPDFYKKFNLDLHVIRQETKALWLARNKAIQFSSAEYILLFDDDSRIDSNWINSHLKCLDYFNADISSGVSLSVVGEKVPDNYNFYRWGDQLDTGNVMIKRKVFEHIGLFDRRFEKQRMGDGEFGLRAYLSGFKNISNPIAKRIHFKASQGGLRELGSWDGWRPTLWWSPRPIPSVLYLILKYFGKEAAFLSIIVNIPNSLIPYRFKGNKIILLLISPFFLIIAPFLIFQVLRSWHIGINMMKSGSVIDTLK